MNLNLHEHTVQRNYSAIWYSLIIHLILLIAAANYIKLDLLTIGDNLKKEFIAILSIEKTPPDYFINELLKKEKEVHYI
jgi:hypothetical protein